jgi:carbon-monoxide dehydrogenase large subunit
MSNLAQGPHALVGPRGMGQAVPRVEDDFLVRGAGRYTDDIRLDGEAHLYLLRSPHAAARIRAIDTTQAARSAGVLGVFTAADLKQFSGEPIGSKVPHARADGSPHMTTPYGLLADALAAYVGDAVVAVVAHTLNQAKDAAELIEVDYESLPSVTSALAAAAPDAPLVWPHAPDNHCMQYRLGDTAACEAAFVRATTVVKERYVISRVATASLEPRASIGAFDRRSGRYTLYASLQMPHEIGRDIARTLGVSPSDVHVVSPDVGGGFGMKLALYQEYLLVLVLSRTLGVPVRWIGERSEAFQSDQHARDTVNDVELALDEHGHFTALRVRTVANLGAYIGQWSLHVPTGNLGGLAGPYRIGQFDVQVQGVFTNTVPVGPYRGAGRPEASYLIERIVDRAARQLGLDAAELRRRNLVDASQMPYATGLVFTYDCGDFPAILEETMAAADWAGFPTRLEASKAQGKLRGIGMAYVIESAGGPSGKSFDEHIEIRFDSNGQASVLAGSHSHGQGHETAFRQMAVEFLGLDFEQVRVVYGDTDRVAHGRGSFGSRTMMAAGSAFKAAAAIIVEKGAAIAAHLLEADARDVAFDAGIFRVKGTDKALTMVDVARAAFNPWGLPDHLDVGLSASVANSQGGITFPNGCHVCEVEIDPQTGVVEIVGYQVVEDVGNVVNPLLLKGQIQGGVVQGIGQALMERIVYAEDNGQLLTGSFMDYAMPRASDVGPIHTHSHPVPTRVNPLGVKGAGEAGAVGALPAVMNAVGHALASVGVAHFDMPASPCRVWEAIQQAHVEHEH